MKNHSQQRLTTFIGISLLSLAMGCTSMKIPANSGVAFSGAAVDDAAAAGGGEYAPVEMRMAREKMVKARKALADKDYKMAVELAKQAQADAKLAESKADSAKAQSAVNVLQDDIKALREELDRAGK